MINKRKYPKLGDSTASIESGEVPVDIMVRKRRYPSIKDIESSEVAFTRIDTPRLTTDGPHDFQEGRAVTVPAVNKDSVISSTKLSLLFAF